MKNIYVLFSLLLLCSFSIAQSGYRIKKGVKIANTQEVQERRIAPDHDAITPGPVSINATEQCTVSGVFSPNSTDLIHPDPYIAKIAYKQEPNRGGTLQALKSAGNFTEKKHPDPFISKIAYKPVPIGRFGGFNLQPISNGNPIHSDPQISIKATRPIPERDIRLLTIVDLGSAANSITYGERNGNLTYLWYNKELNTITNIHRMGGDVGPPGQYSGDLAYDVSFDGGMTWTSQVKVYESNISGGQYNTDAARFPEAAIYNPPGNTDPMNGKLVYFAPVIDFSNGEGWGGYGFGVGSFGDVEDTTKHLQTSDLDNGFYQGIPTSYTLTQQEQVSIVADASLLDNYVEYLGDVIFMRGVYNEGLGDYEYEKFLVPVPCDYARYLKMAFDPTGQTGYVYWNNQDGTIPALDEWSYPLLIRSDDAGETWSDVISVEISGPDGIEAIKNWLSDEMIQNIWEEPYPTRDEIMYSTPWFNTDIAVDAWGNPHLATTVFIAGPGLEPGFVAITPESFGVFDIYSTDDNNEVWEALHLGTLNVSEGEFVDPGDDPLLEYNRVEVARDLDGTKMFFTWLDTRLEGVDDNSSPDIYARSFDLVTNMVTNDQGPNAVAGATNVTAFSDAMWQAYFKSTTHYVMEEGESGSKIYTVPMTYIDMNTLNILDPIQVKYIQNFEVGEDEFTMESGNPPITSVGLPEYPIAINSLSQNFPNPFNGLSEIYVEVVSKGSLSLIINNIMGQRVMDMSKGTVSEGVHKFTISARDLSPGIYFYTAVINDHAVTRKMVVE